MPLNSRNVTYTKIAALSALTCATLVLSNPSLADSAYGPVKSNDTLSKILKRLYTGPKSSQLPMMKQIVTVNPSSFLNGNMNLLKLNSTLVLPGDSWRNTSQKSFSNNNSTTSKVIINDVVDRTATSLTVEQMKGRIVFLDAERSNL